VEIHNPAGTDRDLSGWTISARAGSAIATLPAIRLTAGSYLVVHFAQGTNDLNLTDGRGDFYTQTTASVFSDTMDEAALYSGPPSAATIVDFVAWKASSTSFTGGNAHDMAVQTQIWTAGTFFNALDAATRPWMKTRTVNRGTTIGRDKDSTDTNTPQDWDVLGGRDALDNTPRRQNVSVFGIIIPPPPPPPGLADWTFMVYSDADNNLEKYLFRDIMEMELAPNSDRVNIVVQVDGLSNIQELRRVGGQLRPVPGRQKGGAWRGRIRRDSDPDLVFLHPTAADAAAGTYYLGEPNMADPATLRGFAQWAMANYPARRFALIISDHGAGWKAVAEDVTSNDDWIHMGELRTALQGIGVQLIGFDACLMGMIEVGQQVMGSGSVLVASEEVERGDGWPYDTLLTDLVANPAMDEKAFGARIVRHYQRYYTVDAPDPRHTLSAVDLRTAFPALVTDVSDFGKEMRTGIEDYDGPVNAPDNEQLDIDRARGATESYSDANYLDLSDFAFQIDTSPLKGAYRTKAAPIRARLAAGGGIVLAETHGPSHPNSHGLSIYFPGLQTAPPLTLPDPFDFPDPSFRDVAGSPRVIYAEDLTTEWGVVPYVGQPPHPLAETPNFDFPRITEWDEFLHRFYKPVADAGPDATYSWGDLVTLDGSGSSDADGMVTRWIWDLHSDRDEPPPLPGAGGACGSTGEDWDCDRRDETNDDIELEGAVVTFPCLEPAFNITLSVHDDHHFQHPDHWKTDQDATIIKCLPCRKEVKPATVIPGGELAYTITVANPRDGVASLSVRDPLPPQTTFRTLESTHAGVRYNRASRTIAGSLKLERGEAATIVVTVTVDRDYRPRIVENRTRIEDGIGPAVECRATAAVVRQ
jgi:hypothetical protein